MMYNYFDQMFGWGFGGGIMMIVVWVAVVLFVVWLVKELRNESGKDSARSKTALDILKERYAKGEIDRQEIEEKKKDLVN